MLIYNSTAEMQFKSAKNPEKDLKIHTISPMAEKP